MRVSYDREVDVVMVVLREGEAVARTVEVRQGLVDLNNEGQVVAFELFDAGELLTKAVDMALQPSLETVLTETPITALGRIERRDTSNGRDRSERSPRAATTRR